MKLDCVICQRPGERCHIKSKGSGGSYDAMNIVMMCRFHHSEQHSIGWKKMTKKYPVVSEELQKRGWEFLPWGKLVRS